MEQKLIKQETFNNELLCNFYSDNVEIYMTREQIGEALGYKRPSDIRFIHYRHQERLDKFSKRIRLDQLPNNEGVCNLHPPSEKKRSSGGPQITYLYNRRGVMEICRWSDKPKADAFIDFVWEVMDRLMSGQGFQQPRYQSPPFTDELSQIDTYLRGIADKRFRNKLADKLASEVSKQMINTIFNATDFGDSGATNETEFAILNILNTAKQRTDEYEWVKLSTTEWRDHYAELKPFTVQQIGMALRSLGYERKSSQVKRGGRMKIMSVYKLPIRK